MNTKTNDQLLLLETRPPRLLSVSLDGRHIVELVGNCGGTPDGLAIDYKNRHIYWTNMGVDWSSNDGFIERVDFDGKNRTVIIPEGVTFTPKQIQIDVDAGLLYWCDREGMRVMRSRADGSDITVLVETGSTEADRKDERLHCVGIAIDRLSGRLYWTQKGPPNAGKGRIFSAPLDLPAGMSPRHRSDITLLFDALPEPIDLEWDVKNSLLYWTDRGDPPRGNTLNRCRIVNGVAQTPEILLSGLDEGIGLALDEASGEVYVSDLGGFVRVASVDRPVEPRLLLSGRGALTGIAFWRASGAPPSV
jgi:DNA-binding beta-propeller fold protein YncE